MQPSEETLSMLAQCFRQTQMPDPQPRKQAETFLKQAADQPGYGITVLSLLALQGVGDEVRQAAAVNFKNYVKYHWNPADPDALGAPKAIQDEEKQQIKSHIVELMLSTPPLIKAQISESLSIVSGHDFPAKWQNLLPELISKLSSNDQSVINGVLHTANSIFKRFCFTYKTDALLLELKYCLDLFVQPMLELFTRQGHLVEQNKGNADSLRQLLEAQRILAEIFYSLNFQDLPAFFEDHMQEWMAEFHKYLVYSNPILTEDFPKSNEDDEAQVASITDQLKAAICENVNLYTEKFEEEFQGFLTIFVDDVYNLAKSLRPSPRHDELAIVSLKFLTTVSRSVYHTLFSSGGILESICKQVVIPNAQLRDEDEARFNDDFLEYIRRDMEGSDSDTRRRMACELVRGLSTHYEQQVTHLCSVDINAMLAEYADSPTDRWQKKDCAIYLVVALAVRQKTASAGATATNQLVNVGDFFVSQILPELHSSNADSEPVLKADALKFLTTFRSQVPKQACLELIPQLVKFGKAESEVVHSYAAICVERLLAMREGGAPRFSAADLAPYTEALLGAFFTTLTSSGENQYVMKAIMRLVSVAEVGPVAAQCLAQLARILTDVCRNPSNPSFNHYLFEAVAAVVRRGATTDRALIPTFEQALFPILQTVLGQDIQEFAPYVFQVLALLIETRTDALPPTYMQLFPILVTPQLWERGANVPALVRLLQAYLQRAADQIVSGNQVAPVLGVFQKLVASKSLDHHGFFILNAIVEQLSLTTLAPFMGTIWSLLFSRLQNSKTPKFVRGLVVFMALFIVKHGVPAITTSVDSVHAGLFLRVLESLWITGVPSVTGQLEAKLAAVASTKLLSDSPQLQEDPSLRLWCQVLDSTLTLLVRPEEERVAEENEEDVPDVDELSGYSASYAQLHNAGKKDEDPVPNILDAREFLAKTLEKTSSQFPGRFRGAIQQGLQAANRDALLHYCTSYSVTLA